MSKFAQPVSMYCPSKEDYERDLQQPLLDLEYQESEACNVIHNDNYVFATWSNRFGFAQKKSDVFNKSHHIPTWNPTLAIAIAAMRVGEEIHVGERFICIKDVVMNPSGETRYKKGHMYLSEINGCITNENGNKGHLWANDIEGKFKEHFRKATLQELIDKFGDKEPAAVPFVPKRGDVVKWTYAKVHFIGVFSHCDEKGDYALFDLDESDNLSCDIDVSISFIYKKEQATDQEKQLLFDALAKQGKRYNAEKFCIEDITVTSILEPEEPKESVPARLQEIENIVLGKIIEDDYYRGFGVAEKPKDIPSFAKVLAHKLADETTDLKEAFRLLELVRQEVEQIRQDTIANKTKQRDKLTDEINKLKAVTLK